MDFISKVNQLGPRVPEEGWQFSITTIGITTYIWGRLLVIVFRQANGYQPISALYACISLIIGLEIVGSPQLGSGIEHTVKGPLVGIWDRLSRCQLVHRSKVGRRFKLVLLVRIYGFTLHMVEVNATGSLSDQETRFFIRLLCFLNSHIYKKSSSALPPCNQFFSHFQPKEPINTQHSWQAMALILFLIAALLILSVPALPIKGNTPFKLT
ncbi:uncharacterized protein Bfra_000637 [Botrytis fragariae]|uniref:Uncharacterized protein n=1 Tax=Botrytis fragariae TaxID=1964551 RepID=A0A8H6B2Y3_9HELO|nr:uncharacterized protein Bfra_000637 [Botrytis fragariae]KAF5878471.1 hypothetical protein Bfra_000637 [Botrytis fragariae]